MLTRIGRQRVSVASIKHSNITQLTSVIQSFTSHLDQVALPGLLSSYFHILLTLIDITNIF